MGVNDPHKCPYCRRVFNTFTAFYDGHMRACREAWAKRRQMERKKAGRPALTDDQIRALREKDVFRGFTEESE